MAGTVQFPSLAVLETTLSGSLLSRKNFIYYNKVSNSINLQKSNIFTS